LFATLDPTTRRVPLPSRRAALFTDTVGFIQKLPTTLVAAFRATLEEITEADVLLHVVDATHPNAMEQAVAVADVLAEIDVHDLPMVTALNKVDALPDPEAALSEWQAQAIEREAGLPPEARNGYEQPVLISAIDRTGFNELLARVEQALGAGLVPIYARIPYRAGKLISLFHEQGVVESTEHQDGSVLLRGRVPDRLVARYKPYAVTPRRAK
jgi:GTP-binding protein HflX